VLADSSHADSAALYFLLAAVPAIGVGTLMAFGELADICDLAGRIVGVAQALLSVAALIFALTAIGSSSGSLLNVSVPGLGFSALGGCLGAFGFQAVLAVIDRARRHPPALYVRAGEDFVTAEHIGL
jgi:hypothetical protein